MNQGFQKFTLQSFIGWFILSMLMLSSAHAAPDWFQWQADNGRTATVYAESAIEDAGISFAYAKHFVDGEGFVTYPGGERVEGFSNPLWTFLISIFYAIGISPWTSSKILGAVFGLITLPCIYKITRRMGVNGDFALFAPAMLAVSPQFVVWNFHLF